MKKLSNRMVKQLAPDHALSGRILTQAHLTLKLLCSSLVSPLCLIHLVPKNWHTVGIHNMLNDRNVEKKKKSITIRSVSSDQGGGRQMREELDQDSLQDQIEVLGLGGPQASLPRGWGQSRWGSRGVLGMCLRK